MTKEHLMNQKEITQMKMKKFQKSPDSNFENVKKDGGKRRHEESGRNCRKRGNKEYRK